MAPEIPEVPEVPGLPEAAGGVGGSGVPDGERDRELAERFNLRMRDLVLLLRRVSADQPVTSQQLSVLGSLADGPRRMTGLAEEHGVRLPTMTAQINRLERDGLVVRGRDDSDARVVTVELTPSGERRLTEAREARIAFLAARFAALSDEERAAMAAALPALEKLFAGF